MELKNKRLRKALKFFSVLAIIDLLYLNVFVLVALSIGQIFLIAIEIVRVYDKKGIDVSTLTSDQLDGLIILSIDSVKQVFRENGFRFIPNIINPAYASGKEVVLHYVRKII